MNNEPNIGSEPRQPTVLVVDDEEHIRNGCSKILSQDGFQVATAECGEDGLKMIEEQHFDIILLDLMMPNMSGFDVLARAKSLHPDSVIIVITGYATVEHSIEAMKKGAFDFIPKPFTPEQLRVLVTKAIEYNRALKDIADEKSRMRVLVNHLTDGVMATDSEKNVVLANPAFLRMVGYKGESAVGRPVSEIVRHERIEELIDQALALPTDDFKELADELESDGEEGSSEQILSVRCIPFRDRSGRNIGTITLLHDITALKKVDQMRSNFVSMVAHEIRGPMNSVLMQLQVIQDGLAGPVSEQQMELLQRVSGRVKGLVSLATDLLDLAKIESGLITVEKEYINIADLLTEQVEFHRARAEAKGLSTELELQPDLPPLLADRRNIEEVVSNLIENAINYTPEGGRITVSAKTAGEYCRISVADTGFGIPEEEREKIFAPFYRVRNEKTRFTIGTGLGLPIVKKIVESHHGFIQVQSELDKGSDFQVYIPLIQPQEAAS